MLALKAPEESMPAKAAQRQCTWTPQPRVQQQRRCVPAFEVAATVMPPPYRANWLSERKTEMPGHRAVVLRESAIPRKT